MPLDIRAKEDEIVRILHDHSMRIANRFNLCEKFASFCDRLSAGFSLHSCYQSWRPIDIEELLEIAGGNLKGGPKNPLFRSVQVRCYQATKGLRQSGYRVRFVVGCGNEDHRTKIRGLRKMVWCQYFSYEFCVIVLHRWLSQARKEIEDEVSKGFYRY